MRSARVVELEVKVQRGILKSSRTPIPKASVKNVGTDYSGWTPFSLKVDSKWPSLSLELDCQAPTRLADAPKAYSCAGRRGVEALNEGHISLRQRTRKAARMSKGTPEI